MLPRIDETYADFELIVPPPEPPPPVPEPLALVEADPTGDPRTLQLLADGQARQYQVQAQLLTDSPAAQDETGFTPEKQELLLDLGQIALSVVGVFDPTPISDGVDGVVSLFRGDWLGAGISVVSMIPYVGDLAKAGKLPKFLKVVENVVDIAKTDARFADAVRPLMEQIRDALHAAPLDSLPGPVREPLERMRAKVDEFFAATPATGGDTFVGTLRAQRVELPGVTVRQVDYTKRPRVELDQLRREFDSTVRPAFARDLAGDPQKVARLREAGLTDADIALLRDGRIPPGWQVHHKLPLDDGGNNDFANLVLIKNDPYHLTITNAQNAATRGMREGETRQVEWPIPEGFVYPPRP